MKIFRQFTRKTLMKNRTRTVVTLIGIVLSMALFTAVIEGAYSGVCFMKEAEIERSGSFHGVYSELTADGVEAVRSAGCVEKSTVWQEVGWAEIGSENETKPYLLIQSIGEDFCDLVSVCLESGRMPENEGEILLPAHLLSNGGVSHPLGDVLTLSVGQRTAVDDGYVLHARNPYRAEEETLTVRETRTFTVVGIYTRPDEAVESYLCPGYTALTVGGGCGEYSAAFTVDRPAHFYEETEKLEISGQLSPHTDLLRFLGAEANDSIRSLIYRFAAMLVFLVSLGSVSLIYNSFSISVGERTRQFGILKSVGATKKQIRACVLYEAVLLAGIGIPFGLLVGCTGIGITFYCLQDAFLATIPDGVNISIRMVPNVTALALSALVCAATTIISAWIPARRAMRVSPIEAIRQTNDVRISKRDVRPYRLTQRLFGFEGMMAAKNFRRNRKRYRATVISLVLSMMLFITSSSFCSYLTGTVTGFTSGEPLSDIVYSPKNDKDAEKTAAMLAAIDGVSESVYTKMAFFQLFPDADSARKATSEDRDETDTNGEAEKAVYAYVVFAEDEMFRSLCRENGVDADRCFSADDPQGILYNRQIKRVREGGREKMVTVTPVDRSTFPFALYAAIDHGSVLELPICAEVDDTLFSMAANTPAVMYPFSMQSAVLGTQDINGEASEFANDFTFLCSFRAASHKQVYSEMKTLLSGSGRPTAGLHDLAETCETEIMVVNVISVFAYGFIILISLITIANVFNTISTNVLLRRREFAMMKSVGLSERGFGKMMRFECLIYALRSLIWGLPVSILMTYGIYRMISVAYVTSFSLPWKEIAVAVGSVFAVMIVTMLYACGKIRRDNPIDALKNENT